MAKFKTHYEQVPIASLKIPEADIQRQELPQQRQNGWKKGRAGASDAVKEGVKLNVAHI
ncbi:MAG TPA: hypothetical protein VN862_08200 [Candidatus Acidoferrales bacterium]|jgi:hypothetical protein|nr:hypothetical protein [Candidatus Acidoferrales bacterium]